MAVIFVYFGITMTRLVTLIILFSVTSITARTMTAPEADTKAHEIIKQMSLKEKVYEMSGHGIARFGVSMVFGNKVKQIRAGGNKKLSMLDNVVSKRKLLHKLKNKKEGQKKNT